MKQIYEGLALPQTKDAPSYSAGRISDFIRDNAVEVIDNHSGDLMLSSTARFITKGVTITHYYQAGLIPISKIKLFGDKSKFDEVEKQLLSYCQLSQEELNNTPRIIYQGSALPETKDAPSYSPGRISDFIRNHEAAKIVKGHPGNLMQSSEAIFTIDDVMVVHNYFASDKEAFDLGIIPTATLKLKGDRKKFNEVEKQLLDYCALPQDQIQNGP
jgi:hypothetical protein